ncbi:MAG: apolipoprotein N-acyltransferase [Gelidibacter sp.]
MVKHLLLAIASGLLLALGWPTYGVPLLLFFGLVPLLLIEHQIRTSEGKWKAWKLFGYAYLSFFIWNFITTNWLQYADIFGASFAILVNALLMALVIIFYHKIAKRTTTRISLIFLVCLWMSFEKLHLSWEFSWPWLNLGNGFSEYVSWIQWYEYTGTFGGTLWVWVLNIVVFKAILNYKNQASKSVLKKAVLKIISLILIPIAISLIIYNTYKIEGETVNVIVLQPNIDPYSDKYNTSNSDIADLLIRLSNTKINNSTDFILAPETVFADNVKIRQFKNTLFKHKLDVFVGEHPNVNILSGISFIDFIYDPAKVGAESNVLKKGVWYNDYNSAMLINTKDSVQVYNKSKLVVGVENFPYQEILKPLIGDAMIDLGGTVAMKTTQKNRSVFTSANNKFKAAPIICYESVYGEYVTGYVRNGANFLAIITNDAWWNDTQGHKQHLSYARLRAIETRRAVARSANTGISAFINARGDIINTLAYNKQGALAGIITTNSTQTFYVKAGDYLARIAIFIMLLIVLITFFRKKNNT